MTEDLTKKLTPNTDDKVTLILMAVQDLTFRLGMSEHKFDDFAAKTEQRLQKVGSDIAQLREGQQRLEESQRSLGEGQRSLEERQRSLEQGQKRLEEGQESLRTDLTALRRHVDQQFKTLSGTVEGRYREHDKRIAQLETNTNQANSQT